MNFRVYYADGSTFDGDAFNAPAMNVLMIVELDKDHGRRIVSGGDYYVWDGQWFAVDKEGMFQYLCDAGPRRVLIGRMVDNERWTAIYRRADSDPDFPARTAYGVFERKA